MSTASPDSEFAQLAGGFVHEVKNHLNTLLLHLQLLEEDLEAPETPRERQAKARVARLSSECRRILEVSNDFLKFARDSRADLAPTQLADVVARMVDFLSPTALMKGVRIAAYPAPDLPLVMLDAELFEQALLNLMLNAEDAMPGGGTLVLQARAEGRFVRLDVIDTGVGIEPELAARVFEPFVTAKPGGTGLGLATVRRIVAAHGGSVTLESEPGRGSQFTIRLPLAGPGGGGADGAEGAAVPQGEERGAEQQAVADEGAERVSRQELQ